MAVQHDMNKSKDDAKDAKTDKAQKYTWYSLRLASSAPEQLRNLSLPAPQGWDYGVSIQRERGSYRMKAPDQAHDMSERMSMRTDVRYFRLTDNQYRALVARLDKRCSENGIPVAWPGKPGSLRRPDPKVSELVRLDKQAPREWGDCIMPNEWSIQIAEFVVDSDVDAFHFSAPTTPDMQEKIDLIIQALTEDTERPHKEIVDEILAQFDDTED